MWSQNKSRTKPNCSIFYSRARVVENDDKSSWKHNPFVFENSKFFLNHHLLNTFNHTSGYCSLLKIRMWVMSWQHFGMGTSRVTLWNEIADLDLDLWHTLSLHLWVFRTKRAQEHPKWMTYEQDMLEIRKASYFKHILLNSQPFRALLSLF
ncbi:hypothetical protein BJ165DRAFT_625168 [Panaeolus papilionaceus]|nr:hypothetical protein BJ165DRAFT_625168 [Panaeolus papilionaceus]